MVRPEVDERTLDACFDERVEEDVRGGVDFDGGGGGHGSRRESGVEIRRGLVEAGASEESGCVRWDVGRTKERSDEHRSFAGLCWAVSSPLLASTRSCSTRVKKRKNASKRVPSRPHSLAPLAQSGQFRRPEHSARAGRHVSCRKGCRRENTVALEQQHNGREKSPQRRRSKCDGGVDKANVLFLRLQKRASSCNQHEESPQTVVERLDRCRTKRANERWRAGRAQEQAAARSLRPPESLGSAAAVRRRSGKVIFRC